MNHQPPTTAGAEELNLGAECLAEAVLELWDYAAIQLLVEEAGGRCSTFTGAAPAPGKGFLATNALLHDDLVALLSS